MKNTGLNVKPPRQTCSDPLCPFHGSLGLRGKLLTGRAVSVKTKTTAVIEKEYLHFVKKYIRYEKRRSKIHAHLPSCLGVKEGDLVQIAECRPLAKSVSFVVVSREKEQVVK
jgi:small subunit ribosomal protein S17